MAKKKKVNPQIRLDVEPEFDPKSRKFKKPHGWTKEEIDYYFNHTLGATNKDDFATSKEYVALLINECLAQKHWHDAFGAFLTRVQELGVEIETDQDKYNQMMEKIFYWRNYRALIHASGLGRFEDEIMKYEIAKYYQPPPQQLPAPRVKETFVGRSRPQRPAQPQRPSLFRPEPKPKAPAQPRPQKPAAPKGKG